ncbi:MAG: hypothetical protein ACO36A_09895 [Ilumatobacteraceae bacterium]
MATSPFENHRSSWEITLNDDEINRVRAMLHAISARKDNREFVWVKRTGPSTRRWFVEGYHIRAYLDFPAGPADPEEVIAVPAHVLDLAAELTEPNSEVTLFLNEKENILVCRALDQYSAADCFAPEITEPTFDPVSDVDPVLGGKYMRRVRVKTDVLERIADQYMNLRRSTYDGSSSPTPPATTLAFTPDTIRWTTDWSRLGKPAVSGMAPAVTDRYFDVTFYPLYFWTYVSICPLGSEVSFGWDNHHVAIWGDNWAVWGDELSEMSVRWTERADDVFEEYGFSRNTDLSDNDSLTYENDDVMISVEVIDGAAGTECLRLTYILDSGVEVTREVLAETMALSDRLVAAKLAITESFLTVTVDVDNPRNSDQFKDGVAALLAAIGRCGDFAKALPLFGDVIPPYEPEVDPVED